MFQVLVSQVQVLGRSVSTWVHKHFVQVLHHCLQSSYFLASIMLYHSFSVSNAYVAQDWPDWQQNTASLGNTSSAGQIKSAFCILRLINSTAQSWGPTCLIWHSDTFIKWHMTSQVNNIIDMSYCLWQLEWRITMNFCLFEIYVKYLYFYFQLGLIQFSN